MLTLGKWAFALSSTILKIWKPFPKNPIRQLIANGHPKLYTKQYKAWVQKNTFWQKTLLKEFKTHLKFICWACSRKTVLCFDYRRSRKLLLAPAAATAWCSKYYIKSIILNIFAATFWLIVVCPRVALALPPLQPLLPASAVTSVGCRRHCHCGPIEMVRPVTNWPCLPPPLSVENSP